MVNTINGTLLAACLALPLTALGQGTGKLERTRGDPPAAAPAAPVVRVAKAEPTDGERAKSDEAGAGSTGEAGAASTGEAGAASTGEAGAASPGEAGAASQGEAATVDAAELVRRADEIRFPRESFQVDVRVNSTIGGEAQDQRVYRVLSKGNENTIVLTLEPPTERGQNMLMRGRDLWVFMPNVSQPVRLSLSQRLTGQVANGDLARANFAGDYDAKLLRTEQIDGRDHHVLELVAAQRGVTYPRVLYWVRADDHHPNKAEFYAVSGRLLKTVVYENYQPLGGQVRPTRLVMTDALKEGDRSVLEYSELELRELPDRMFTKDYMKRLD